MIRSDIRQDEREVARLEQFTLTVPKEAFAQGKEPELSQRSAEFATDEEAWAAVNIDPRYIILSKKFQFAPEEWPDNDQMMRTLKQKLSAGDKLTLNVFNKPAAPNTPGFGKDPELAGTADIEIAGFADTNTGMEFYNMMFVHPEIADKFRAEGFRWSI
ncbi:hypothetical protein [Paenibacillus sp. FJAT-26967]|uniref:hypothetical protein n=1 Tax=Paenibacillus sp. FJAT-26967 TaxID=1729690 RepID=UPI000838EFA7|nr:hypothetical protein [Paenibacillus sp. FJAT-26967]